MSLQRRRPNGKICPLNTGILLTLGLLLCLAHPAEAQFIGDRIRITTENGEKIIGELQGYDDSSITLLADSAEQRVAYDDMAKLRRSLGRRSYARKGAWAGLAAGTMLGLTWVITDSAPGFAIPVFGLTGSMIGFTVSAPFKAEQWERLDISGHGRSSVLSLIGIHAKFAGDLMRITNKSGRTITGRLRTYDARSLTVLANSTERSIAYADMLSLERRQGVRRFPVQGALAGLGIGVLVAMVGVASFCDNTCEGGAAIGTAIFALGSTAGGTALGLFVGTLIRKEKWERLDIPGQERGMSVAPVIGTHPNGHLALGARISLSLDRR